MTAVAVETDPGRRSALARRVRFLVAATISYNVVEAVVALAAGAAASSGALIGFGLDSVVEVGSAAAVAWQFSARDPARRDARERRALRIVAFSFFALAAYVGAESVVALLGEVGVGTGGDADRSPVGLVLAAVSLVVMPALSYVQRRTGRRLGSASVVADSKQTLLCTALSAVVLVGVGLNLAFGWSWADPVAALVVAVLAVREGVAAWRGDACCATAPLSDGDAAVAGCAGGCGPGCTGPCCAPSH